LFVLNGQDGDANGTRQNDDGLTNSGFFADEPEGATASPKNADGVFFIGDSPVLQRKVSSDGTVGFVFESNNGDKQVRFI